MPQPPPPSPTQLPPAVPQSGGTPFPVRHACLSNAAELVIEKAPGETTCGLLLDSPSLRVREVEDGGAAARAGGQAVVGMRLVSVGGVAVRAADDVLQATAAPGPLVFGFVRDAEPIDRPAVHLTTPGDFVDWGRLFQPRPAADSPKPPKVISPQRPATSGLSDVVSQLDEQLRQAPDTESFLATLATRIRVARATGAIPSPQPAAPPSDPPSEEAPQPDHTLPQHASTGSAPPAAAAAPPAPQPHPQPSLSARTETEASSRRCSGAQSAAEAQRTPPPSARTRPTLTPPPSAVRTPARSSVAASFPAWNPSTVPSPQRSARRSAGRAQAGRRSTSAPSRQRSRGSCTVSNSMWSAPVQTPAAPSTPTPVRRPRPSAGQAAEPHGVAWTPDQRDADFFELLESGIRHSQAAAQRPLPVHEPTGAAAERRRLAAQRAVARQQAADRGPKLTRSGALDFSMEREPCYNISTLRREESASPPPRSRSRRQRKSEPVLQGQCRATATKTGLWTSLPRSVHDRMEVMAAWRPKSQV